MLENVMLGVVPQYFDKYYKIAISIYTCATGVGITIVPLVTQALLSTYGWRGALLLIAGFGLHTIPFGALLHSEKPTDTNDVETKPLVDGPSTSINNEDQNSEHKNNLKTAFRKIISLMKLKPFLARVLVPGFVHGYIFNGWMVYIVSYAISNGASLRASSIVASCGGIGVFLIRMCLPYLNKITTYRHIMYSSSCLAAVSFILMTIFTSVAGMSVISVFFGIGLGGLGGQIYIVTKDVAPKDQYFNVIAVFHLFFGVASILSGIITGKPNNQTHCINFFFFFFLAFGWLTRQCPHITSHN